MTTKPSDDNLVENDLFGNNAQRYCSNCGTTNNIFKPRGTNGETDFSLKIDVLETTVSSMHKILVIQGQQINHLQEIVSEQAKEISKLNVNFLQQSIINDLRNETLSPYYSQPFPLPDVPPSSLLTHTAEYPNISNLNISTESPRPDSPSSTHSSVSNSSISTSLPFLLSFDNFQENDSNITNNYPKANKLCKKHDLLSFSNDKVKLKTDNHHVIKTPKINIIDKIQEFANIHETSNENSIPQNHFKRSENHPQVPVEDEDDSEEEKFGTANNNDNNIHTDSNSKRVSSQNMKKRKKLKAKKLRFNNIKSTFLAAQRFINPNPETMTSEEIHENERVLQSFKVLKVKLLSFLPSDFFTATFYGREYDLFDNVAVVMAMKYADIHEFSNEKLQSIAAGLMDDWNFCAKNWT